MQYRNEIKYLVTPSDRDAICTVMKIVAQLDPYAAEKGFCTVHSLFFESMADSVHHDIEDEINKSETFRFRYFNGDTSVIHLEKIVKRDGVRYKASCDLTALEVQRIVNGDIQWMGLADRSLVIELYKKMKTHGLRPMIIVNCERIPFVHGSGNVRVTVDYNIRTGIRFADFLNPDCQTVPAEAGRDITLEIRWDDYLPTVIRHAVQMSVSNEASTAYVAGLNCL